MPREPERKKPASQQALFYVVVHSLLPNYSLLGPISNAAGLRGLSLLRRLPDHEMLEGICGADQLTSALEPVK